MADVRVYTTGSCPYCVQAKRLLDRKGVTYREIDLSADAAQRAEVMRASGRRTVPQIFINDQSIGGFDELYELEQSGHLDTLLDAPA